MDSRMWGRNWASASILWGTIFVAGWTKILVAADPPPLYPEHQDLMYLLAADGVRTPISAVPQWEQRRRHIQAHMQTVMGAVPRPEMTVALEPRILLADIPLENGLIRRVIAYHTDSPDRVVHAYLFVPKHRDGERLPTVLCLHQTTKIGKAEPAGLGGNPNLHYALHLAQRGYVTLAPDYPSFGDYAYNFPTSDGYISGTMKAIYDNIRAIDLLQAFDFVDPERIGCIGHSLGGHNAIFTAAFDERIKAVVSNCGFTRFHKYYGGKLKGWTSARYMPLINDRYANDPDQVPFDFPEIIGCLAPRPFLASSPLRDDNFEVSGVKDSIDSARFVYRLYGQEENLQANYPDCAHDFPEPVRTVAYEFLDRHLKPGSRKGETR